MRSRFKKADGPDQNRMAFWKLKDKARESNRALHVLLRDDRLHESRAGERSTRFTRHGWTTNLPKNGSDKLRARVNYTAGAGQSPGLHAVGTGA